jgi:hypothetical protein
MYLVLLFGFIYRVLIYNDVFSFNFQVDACIS